VAVTTCAIPGVFDAFYRKPGASELRYMGHTLSDNRHGLVANAVATIADGYAEREAAKVRINIARQALDVTRWCNGKLPARSLDLIRRNGRGLTSKMVQNPGHFTC
jgi:hypothetical protein